MYALFQVKKKKRKQDFLSDTDQHIDLWNVHDVGLYQMPLETWR